MRRVDHERTRLVSWLGVDPERVDTASVRLLDDRLEAHGTSTCPDWLLTYRLWTDAAWVTRRLDVRVDTDGGTRTLTLRQDDDGRWSAQRHDAPPHSGATVRSLELPDLDGALDCDLGLCPLTNTMPILREGLVEAAQAGQPHGASIRTAWVSVPDLEVSRSEQHYAAGAPVGRGGALIRFSTGAFACAIEVDREALVVAYPGIGRRIHP